MIIKKSYFVCVVVSGLAAISVGSSEGLETSSSPAGAPAPCRWSGRGSRPWPLLCILFQHCQANLSWPSQAFLTTGIAFNLASNTGAIVPHPIISPRILLDFLLFVAFLTCSKLYLTLIHTYKILSGGMGMGISSTIIPRYWILMFTRNTRR